MFTKVSEAFHFSKSNVKREYRSHGNEEQHWSFFINHGLCFVASYSFE